ncbi:uncharacterized protein LOC120419986 [Culex pipiens pallens]|uniref:uncharacterized protein LOC120419986 n=1 Tax=Culex pipiens pallens TaxID=42434 RepID=UPI0022AAF313|nr:uncharacterized protein LOC120419986 [Culex pipiens pallens]
MSDPMKGPCFNMRGTVINGFRQFICYADDIGIVDRTFEEAARKYTELKRETAKVGLRVNVAKTAYLLAGETESLSIGPSVTIDGDEFEIVEEFVYLGSLVTSDNNRSRGIWRRSITGSRVYYGLHKTLRSGTLFRRTKCTLYETLIRPVVLYGHETWMMLEEELQALETINPVKLVFTSEPVGTRRRGATRKWLNQVEKCLESVGNWRDAAQIRVRWQRIWRQLMTRKDDW